MSLRILLVAVAVFSLASAAFARDPIAKPSKDIDLVLCLDVSNSMDGLIDSAKLKLWDIVNELARVRPVPNLRVGLYSYGHTNYPKEKGWVRKDLDLTTDLDEVYRQLNALRTNGGEEYVARVTQTALLEQKWSHQDGALKLIFVCGNEPANQDQEVKLDAVAKMMKTAGVIVNTIYCGNADNAEARGWSDYARACGGRYASIDQDKARQQAVVVTPFDKELNDLSGKLNSTYVRYGHDGARGGDNQVAQDLAASKAAPAAGASRAVSKAEGLYKNSTWDLVDKIIEDPKYDVKALKAEDLPEEMRKLKPEERMDYLKKKVETRKEIQKQITDLGAKRQKHIDEETKKQPKPAGEVALDDALKAMIREQAAEKGFEIPAKK
ncbi:hypothetical protein BH11PLA2_BH11PLA2_46340 [soil metagenome]